MSSGDLLHLLRYSRLQPQLFFQCCRQGKKQLGCRGSLDQVSQFLETQIHRKPAKAVQGLLGEFVTIRENRQGYLDIQYACLRVSPGQMCPGAYQVTAACFKRQSKDVVFEHRAEFRDCLFCLAARGKKCGLLKRCPLGPHREACPVGLLRIVGLRSPILQAPVPVGSTAPASCLCGGGTMRSSLANPAIRWP